MTEEQIAMVKEPIEYRFDRCGTIEVGTIEGYCVFINDTSLKEIDVYSLFERYRLDRIARFRVTKWKTK